MGGSSDGGERIDVLVVTAIKLEYDELLKVDTGAAAGGTWETRTGPTGFEVSFRTFGVAGGASLRFAAIYALQMGGVATAEHTGTTGSRAYLRAGGGGHLP